MSNTATEQSAGETAILDAAVRLFSASGFNAVSMREIAASAGVSKANIYHHFDSKEALYRAILDQSASELSGLVEMLAEGSGSYESRIAEFAVGHLQHLEKNSLASRLIIREAFSGGDDKSRMLVDQVFGSIFERIVSIFQAGQQAGALRSDLDPALCATLLMGADVFFFQARGMLKQLPQAEFASHPPRFSREMVEVLLRGMSTPAQEELL
jgi:TetR/AcrR family transcriptional regulator